MGLYALIYLTISLTSLLAFVLLLFCYWLWLILLPLRGHSNYCFIFYILENRVSIEEDRFVYKCDYIIVPMGSLFYLLGVLMSEGQGTAQGLIDWAFLDRVMRWGDDGYWLLYLRMTFLSEFLPWRPTCSFCGVFTVSALQLIVLSRITEPVDDPSNERFLYSIEDIEGKVSRRGWTGRRESSMLLLIVSGLSTILKGLISYSLDRNGDYYMNSTDFLLYSQILI